MKDYYSILGISKTASQDDVKKAYRRLAHKHHPDRRGGNEARFKEINEAYQILGNPEKRAQYDRYGRVFEGGGGWGPFGPARGGDFFAESPLEDLFADFFEMFGESRPGESRTREERVRKGRDLSLELTLALEDIASGQG